MVFCIDYKNKMWKNVLCHYLNIPTFDKNIIAVINKQFCHNLGQTNVTPHW